MSVAEDVRSRRTIEADRAKPRSTARAVTVITLGVLVVLGLNGSYIRPYTSGLGQLVLAVLLTGYGAVLWWMRQMTQTRPLPRFLATSPLGAGRDDSARSGGGSVLPVHPPAPHHQMGDGHGGLTLSPSSLRTAARGIGTDGGVW